MEDQREKKKLTVEKQIQNMVEKNIKFELCSKEDAQKFLKYNNYYFKLKSYARNYIIIWILHILWSYQNLICTLEKLFWNYRWM